VAGPSFPTRPGGPHFDDLTVGDHVDPGPLAPALTVTEGLAVAHRGVLGDRLPLALSAPLATAVTGGPVLHPALVWDVAIGQSTAFTRRVVANLFYRGLGLHRLPAPGDTLATRTEVVGLRQSRSKPVGMAALRVSTRDQHDRTVLDFWRCAMLPLSDASVDTGHADDLDALGAPVPADDLERSVAGWDLSAFPGVAPPAPGTAIAVAEGDVVSSAPELARLTLNLAAVHHDARPGGGRRLVYGGHTIGLALTQAARAVPGLVTVLAWEGCDHTGPVHEGDTLASTVTVLDARPGAVGTLLDLRSVVHAVSGTDETESREVLDWRFTALATS
jgi:acyl dehydratase